MNQILSQKNAFKHNLKVEFSNEIIYVPYKENKKLYKLKHYFISNKYEIQFFSSLFIAVIACLLLFISIKNANQQEKLSKILLNNYTLTTVYQNKVLSDANISENTITKDPFVIGMICINKINLNYPILSQSNTDLLKISLCRFAGPMPNEIGNLCIAGHNYVDYRFFSRLKELNKNDLIEIYDLTGKKLIYTVFDIYEVNPNDLSCISQNVDEKKIITLTTCNNVNGKRLVVQAQSK